MLEVTNMVAVTGRAARLAACVLAIGCGMTGAEAQAHTSVVPPKADRPWGGCRLNLNTTNALVTETGGPVDFIVAYSFNPSAGQAVGTTVPQPYTGAVLCGAPNTWVTSYTERTPLPNSQTGGTSINILNTEQSQFVRYKDTQVNGQICNQIGEASACWSVTPGTGSSVCRLSTSSYNAIVTAIKAGTGIVKSKVKFNFVMAYSIDSPDAGRICSAPTFAATAKTSGAIAGPIDVQDTEDMLLMRYSINGGARDGEVEKRLCLTAGEQADCFRLYFN